MKVKVSDRADLSKAMIKWTPSPNGLREVLGMTGLLLSDGLAVGVMLEAGSNGCCRFRKLDSCVSMVQSAKDRMRNNDSEPLDLARAGRVLA